MASETTTVFHLELTARDAFRPKPSPRDFTVAMVTPADPAINRDFYRLVGASWRWTDRLPWSAADWQRYVCRDALGTWIGRSAGRPVGYFELETHGNGDVQIRYFGLLPESIGRGLGGPLLSRAVEIARHVLATPRVWVHTCTDDHPHALANYLARGFTIFRTERIEKRT